MEDLGIQIDREVRVALSLPRLLPPPPPPPPDPSLTPPHPALQDPTFTSTVHDKASLLSTLPTNEDLFLKLAKLEAHLELLALQEDYIKDESRNLKRELLRAQEEVKRIQSVPLVIGQFLEPIDTNTAIVGSTTGSNYVVRILSTIDRELLKPSSSVALHRHSNALVDVLPPEADSSISMLGADERPDVCVPSPSCSVSPCEPATDSRALLVRARSKYSDIGGMDIQKQEIREAVELPLTQFDLYRQIGIDPPRGVLLYGPPGASPRRSRPDVLALDADPGEPRAQARARRCSSRPSRITRRRRSSASTGPSLCRSTSARARAWCAMCSAWRGRTRPPSSLSTRCVPASLSLCVRNLRDVPLTSVMLAAVQVDAIATKRFDAQTGADREVQRILIELLTQMDGFDQGSNVKVIMATNRADTLDPALLRPGRLDRKIEFPNPSRREKRLIFQTITGKMSIGADVDLEDCASCSAPLRRCRSRTVD